MEKHYHYIFVAYDESEKVENGTTTIQFPVRVEIQDASSEKEALNRAKKITTRKNYYLDRAFECTSCYDEEDKSRHEAIQMTQLKIMSKALKSME